MLIRAVQRVIVAMRPERPQSKVRSDLFTSNQFLILKLRSRGLTQLQTARQLETSRANVSMIEHRARNKLEKARATLRAYESIQSTHSVKVGAGTRLQEIPSFVLHEGD
ncbi:MAG: Tfx family DNA-binding protein, partial [Nitrososphaerales archaeon]